MSDRPFLGSLAEPSKFRLSWFFPSLKRAGIVFFSGWLGLQESGVEND
mgnify:CR=1 FL=1